MADTKVSDLTAKTSIVGGDELYLVDNDASPASKKGTWTNFKKSITRPVHFNIKSPSAAEDQFIWFTGVAVTLTSIRAVIVGTSLTFSIKHNTDRSAAGTDIVASTALTNTTTGVALTLAVTAIPASSFIWLESSAVTACTDVGLTFFYYETV